MVGESLPLLDGGFDPTEAPASGWRVDLQWRKHGWRPEYRRRCLRVGDGSSEFSSDFSVKPCAS